MIVQMLLAALFNFILGDSFDSEPEKSFSDSRDGNTYQFVEINTLKWMNYGKYAIEGIRNTFWIDAELLLGDISHWHTFGDKQELHNHNVVVSKRQFLVRCVCELD